MKIKTEESLLQRIQQCDKAAFSEFYASYAKRSYSFAFAYLRDKHLAEEAIQIAWLSFLKRLMLGEVLDRPLPYLFRSIKLTCSTVKKRERRYLKFDEASDSEMDISLSPVKSPVDTLLQDEQRMMLWSEIDELVNVQKEVIYLHCKLDMTFKEIHMILKVPLGTVLKRFYSGIKILKQRLEHKLDMKS